MKQKCFLIIDSNAVIHRAFHALPPLTTKKGEMVNAIYGFLLVFFKAIREFKPDFIVAAFDFPAPSFRKERYELYKAQRKKAPDELYEQIPKIKEILKIFNVYTIEKKGFEADDIIGTLASGATELPASSLFRRDPKRKNLETFIITGDMDMLRLVNKKTKVYFLRRGVKDAIIYDEEKTKERYDGLNPGQLSDYKALRGDPSDNIPGVSGVGEKTAIFLIKKFGTLENLYKKLEERGKNIEELKKSLKENLLSQKKQAFTSKMLAEIRFDVPLNFNLKNCRWGEYNRAKIKQVFEKYQFQTLLTRLP